MDSDAPQSPISGLPDSAPEPRPDPLAAHAIGHCANHPCQPAIAPCDRCGLFICAQCAEVQSDGRTLCGPCVDKSMGGARLPWETDQDDGWHKAWWETVKAISFQPDRSLRGVGVGEVRSAVAFGVLTQCIGYVLYLPFQFGLALLDPAVSDAERTFMLAMFAGLFLTLPVWIGLGMVIGAVFMHPFLRMVGGQGSYDATLRGMAYSSAPQAFYAVPCFGPLVGGALALVCFVYAQKHAHGISGGKVIVAWLFLLIASVFVVLIISGLVAVVAGTGG